MTIIICLSNTPFIRSDTEAKLKAKLKLSLCLTKHHSMKAYWGVEVKLHSFDLGSGQLYALATFSQGKSPQYPLNRKLGGPQNCSGRGGEEKNSQPPPGIEP
jgi:hypothetical protein